jgi:hypothetical protein
MAKSSAHLWRLLAVAIGSMAVLGGLSYQLDRIEVLSLWADFIGGFHPVVLHLPIGIVIAIVGQSLWKRWRGAESNDDRVLWFLAALTATLSFGTGYLLVMGGGYQSEHLNWHLWGAAVFTSLCWVGLAAACWNAGRRTGEVIAVGVIASVSFTGHYGGLMVHGDPFAGAPWLNDPARFATFGEFGEEVNVYGEIVTPILGAKCVACHGPAKQNGRLRLDSFTAIAAGGEHGRVLIPGDVERSTLLSVLRLPLNNHDHMPPPNRPQIADPELIALEYWVSSGGEEDQVFSLANPPAELAVLLEPGYRLLEDPDAVAAREAREAADANRRAENRARLSVELVKLPEHMRLGFSFEDLESDRLHFSPATHRHLLTIDDLESLLSLLQDSVEVDFSGLPVSENLLRGIAASEQVSEIDFSETDVGNEVFELLAGMPALERLNIFGTRIDASAQIPAGGLANLKQLFVAQTNADVAALKTALPHVEIIGDLALPPPEVDEPVEEEKDD